MLGVALFSGAGGACHGGAVWLRPQAQGTRKESPKDGIFKRALGMLFSHLLRMRFRRNRATLGTGAGGSCYGGPSQILGKSLDALALDGIAKQLMQLGLVGDRLDFLVQSLRHVAKPDLKRFDDVVA